MQSCFWVLWTWYEVWPLLCRESWGQHTVVVWKKSLCKKKWTEYQFFAYQDGEKKKAKRWRFLLSSVFQRLQTKTTCSWVSVKRALRKSGILHAVALFLTKSDSMMTTDQPSWGKDGWTGKTLSDCSVTASQKVGKSPMYLVLMSNTRQQAW